MRVSWNWLREFVDLSSLAGPEALADLLTFRGLEVEAIDRQDQGLAQVVTAQILEKKQHPEADRLSICTVSLGSGDPLEIVCGAANMKAGDKVALAQIGAHLPNGLKIQKSKIRGMTSYGMLCSEEELKLAETSEGILILPADTSLGVPLAEVLGRTDVLLTLKLTANRGDCLSHLGIAREVASALGVSVTIPSLATSVVPEILVGEKSSKDAPMAIALEAGDLAPQFYGCSLTGVKVGPSPAWLVRRLETLGVRSINNVVDASNLVMLELGHPTHAYDATQIQGKKISVRQAKAGETLPLLDGQTIELQGFELVIADHNRAIGLAGVMGGGNSEVQAHSQEIFLECAQFHPSLIRKAATTHQRKTEASHRFERGVDPEGLARAMRRLCSLILELTGGKLVHAQGVAATASTAASWIEFDEGYLSRFLGLDSGNVLTDAKIKAILEGLGCAAHKENSHWKVLPPSFRLDLKLREDIAEEIARSIGYSEIPSTIPVLSGSPVFEGSAMDSLRLMNGVKDTLHQLGLYETMNFAFTSESWLSQFGMSSQSRLLNPLSEELQCLVPSLVPGLIRNALGNWNHHFGSEPLGIRLFELRPVFEVPEGSVHASSEMTTGVKERWKLCFALSGPRLADGLRNERGEVDFYDLRAVVDRILDSLGTRGARYQNLPASSSWDSLLHPGQSAVLRIGNQTAGALGLLHPGLAQKLKTRAPLWICELDWETLVSLSRGARELPVFKSWPDFPQIERDFALIVKDSTPAEKLCQLALKAGKPLAKSAKVFDIYRGAQVAEGMTSVAVRVIFYEEGRSLQESEAEAASSQIVQSWKKECGAELRG